MIPVDATQLSSMSEVFDSSMPGAFAIVDKFNGAASLIYVCPCGCSEVISLPIHEGPKQDRFWAWDGNHEKPTLSPSINRLDGCRFHGFLKAGVWTSV